MFPFELPLLPLRMPRFVVDRDESAEVRWSTGLGERNADAEYLNITANASPCFVACGD